MLIFYFLFFWFLNNFVDVVNFNLKDNRFNLLNEFFFCLDSFSTSFIIFYLVLFFLAYDFFLNKFFLIKSKKNNNFFYLKIRFFIFILTKMTSNFFIFFTKKIKFIFLSNIFILHKGFNFIQLFLPKKILMWRPLFKRWSYFGLWAKKNNKN